VSSSTVNYEPETACSSGDYDPEWWSHEHVGRCSTGCPHVLAAHICLNHCPSMQRCQEIAAMNPSIWAGMVIGGMMYSGNRRHRTILARFQPYTVPVTCSSCEQVPDLAS